MKTRPEEEKKYKKQGQDIESETESSSGDDDTFLLDDWDNWLDNSEAHNLGILHI